MVHPVDGEPDPRVEGVNPSSRRQRLTDIAQAKRKPRPRKPPVEPLPADATVNRKGDRRGVSKKSKAALLLNASKGAKASAQSKSAKRNRLLGKHSTALTLSNRQRSIERMERKTIDDMISDGEVGDIIDFMKGCVKNDKLTATFRFQVGQFLIERKHGRPKSSDGSEGGNTTNILTLIDAAGNAAASDGIPRMLAQLNDRFGSAPGNDAGRGDASGPR